MKNKLVNIHFECPNNSDDIPFGKIFELKGWIASNTKISKVEILISNNTYSSELATRGDVKKIHGNEYQYFYGFGRDLDTSILYGKESFDAKIFLYNPKNTLIDTGEYCFPLDKSKSESPHFLSNKCHSLITSPQTYNDVLGDHITIKGWVGCDVELGKIIIRIDNKEFTPARTLRNRVGGQFAKQYEYTFDFTQVIETTIFKHATSRKAQVLFLDNESKVIGQDLVTFPIQRQNELYKPKKTTKHDYTLIFHHIEKTAGTTIRDILLRQYEPEETYFIYNGEPLFRGFEDFKMLSDYQKRKIRIIYGHNTFQAPKYFSTPYKCCAFLRDPLKRLFSLYYFILRHKGTPLHTILHENKYTFTDFVTSGCYIQTDNSLVRKLSGVKFKFGECKKDFVEMAKQNIIDNYPVIGVVERFDESILMMRRVFCWRTPFYTKANVAWNKTDTRNLKKQDLDLINNHIKYDNELYSYANKFLDDLIKEEGDSFQKELEEFNKVNSLSRKWLKDTDAGSWTVA